LNVLIKMKSTHNNAFSCTLYGTNYSANQILAQDFDFEL